MSGPRRMLAQIVLLSLIDPTKASPYYVIVKHRMD